MFKTTTIIFTLLSNSLLLQAQPYFDWGNQLGGTDYDIGNSVAVDASGNVYTTGLFTGTADFNPGSGTFNMTASGSFDIFVSKLDAQGQFVWAKQLGGPDDDIANSIAIDANGNLCITGSFQSTADFNPGAGTFNLISAGDLDIFVCKLDASGNLVWAKRMGGTLDDDSYSIAIDKKGNIYTTGGFAGTADFNPGAGTADLISTGIYNFFISKLNSSGNFVWAKKFGGTGDNWGNSITTDASGNVYTTGYFDNMTDFDPGSGTNTITTKGNSDIFISKLDSSGNFILARQLGGTGIDEAYSIRVDASGYVYTTGSYSGTCDFNPAVANTFNLASTGNEDIFVCKLDASCNFVWARHMGGNNDDIAYSMDVDLSGNIYTTGYFNSLADFDPGSNSFNLSSWGRDIFISKLDSSGNFAWAKQIGGSGVNNRSTFITLDSKRNIYTTGGFDDTVDLNPNAQKYLLTAFGSIDIFVHRMSQCIPSSSSISRNACVSYTSPSGRYTWTSSNTYKDTILNTGGCDSIITILLAIGPLDISVTKNGATLTANQTDATYQWINCNNGNQPISGKINQSFTPTVNGSYAVIITQSTCKDTSSCYAVTTAGIGENEFRTQYILYPNPVLEVLTIISDSYLYDVTFKLIDFQGRNVMEKTNRQGREFYMDMSAMTSGIYFMEISKGGLINRFKLIKE